MNPIFPTQFSVTGESASPQRAAVVGAGMAGAACAEGLRRAGFTVTVFEKSRGVGGRMATRRAAWADAAGAPQTASFDHGSQGFSARSPRFKAVVGRAQALGHLARWRPRVHAEFPAPVRREMYVPLPTMSAFCRHLLAGVEVRLGQAVRRLRRDADGWHLLMEGGDACGPFDQVLLALPAPQAARLLAGHDAAVVATLAGVQMQPCWTLMAICDDVDWPWDAAEPGEGPLALVARVDRTPGRAAPAGRSIWIAHATAPWSAAHLNDEPESIRSALCEALGRQLPGRQARLWQHTAVHRWRHAFAPAAALGTAPCWWQPALQLGACSDAFGNGTVEAAWRSGDELADTVAAWLEFNDPALAPADRESAAPGAASVARQDAAPEPLRDRGAPLVR